jgi:high affinity sulfate transporter 1
VEVAQVVPGVAVLRHYRSVWLRGDVLAGITVAAYLVPQVMAYAQVAGLPPVAGLWCVLATLPVYAALGSSRQLSVGPESTTALLAASTLAPLALGDPVRYAALAATLACLVGLLCLLAWALRLGVLADLFGRPVLLGYLAGVALIMIVGQLERLTGVPVSGTTLIDELGSFLSNLDQVHGPTLALGLSVLVFLLVLQRLAPRAPGPLLAVVLASAAVALLDLANKGIAVVGVVPAGLPRPTLPSLTGADVQLMLLPALGVMVVAYTDNILTARSFARRAGHDLDANQEFLALGGANVGASLVGGFPVSSSASRTAVGEAAGSHTQLHSLVAAGCVVLTLLFLRPALAAFPTAALGGIVVYAALRLIDVAALGRLWLFSRTEFGLAIAATAGVLLFDILYGVLVAVGLSLLIILWQVARPNAAVLGTVPGLAGMHGIDDFPDALTEPGLVVFRYDATLFFANADDFRTRARRALDEARRQAAADGGLPPAWLLLNAEAMVDIDSTGVDALGQLREDLASDGVVLALARAKSDLCDDLERAGLLDLIGREHVYPTLPTALAGYREWRAEHPAASE